MRNEARRSRVVKNIDEIIQGKYNEKKEDKRMTIFSGWTMETPVTGHEKGQSDQAQWNEKLVTKIHRGPVKESLQWSQEGRNQMEEKTLELKKQEE